MIVVTPRSGKYEKVGRRGGAAPAGVTVHARRDYGGTIASGPEVQKRASSAQSVFKLFAGDRNALVPVYCMPTRAVAARHREFVEPLI